MNGSRHLVRLCALAALALCTSPARAEDAAPRQADRAQLQIAPNAAVAWDEGPAEAPKGERPPNIVLILADDLGFNDIAFYGGGVAGGRVPTPNIDSIARDGAHFTNGYSGHANCAPSRAALMTGRYPTRFGFAFTPTPLGFARSLGSVVTQGRRKVYRADLEDAVPPVEEMGLPTDETTLAELLAARGYHTVQLGKWHLGESPRFLPERQGFDEWLGFPAGASLFLPKDDPRAVNSVQPYDPIDVYLWDHLQYFVRKDGGAPFRPDTHMTDYLSDEAVRVIAANRNRPFFLYLAYNAPHTPLQALKEDYDALGGIEDHTLRVYAAMIRQLDRGIGRVLRALEEQGLAQDTLVVFTSDNGGADYIGLEEINRPYRGWKSTFFEGGIHVPYFLRWPGVVPAGASLAAPVSHFDVFATAAAAAGAPLPADRPIDGVDLVPYLTGAAAGRPHEVLFWGAGGYQVVRAGDRKLQVEDIQPRTWLFDLGADPTERHDLAGEMPDEVARLTALIEAHKAQQAAPLWPALVSRTILIDRSLEKVQDAGDEFVFTYN